MTKVSALGYIIITAEDLDAWSRFAVDGLGMDATHQSDGSSDDSLRFRLDERSWRLGVEKGPNGGLVALGIEVPNAESLDELGEELEQAGFRVRFAPEIAQARKVSALFCTNDPSGIPLEFFYGAKIEQAPFVSQRSARFVTGEQGIGHAVVMTEDSAATYRFYVDLLGFRVSDTIEVGRLGLAYFASPNSRHHSIAWAQVPAGMGGRLQHMMVEVDDLDTVGRMQDYCMDNDVPIRSMLGRHTNDRVLSIYVESPSGLVVEYGYGGRRIDSAEHRTEYYDENSFWGHRPPSGAKHDR